MWRNKSFSSARRSQAWTICDINRRDSQRLGEGVFEVTLKDHMGWGGGRWAKIPRLWQSRSGTLDAASVGRRDKMLILRSTTRQPAFEHQLLSVYF